MPGAGASPLRIQIVIVRGQPDISAASASASPIAVSTISAATSAGSGNVVVGGIEVIAAVEVQEAEPLPDADPESMAARGSGRLGLVDVAPGRIRAACADERPQCDAIQSWKNQRRTLGKGGVEIPVAKQMETANEAIGPRHHQAGPERGLDREFIVPGVGRGQFRGTHAGRRRDFGALSNRRHRKRRFRNLENLLVGSIVPNQIGHQKELHALVEGPRTASEHGIGTDLIRKTEPWIDVVAVLQIALPLIPGAETQGEPVRGAPIALNERGVLPLSHRE